MFTVSKEFHFEAAHSLPHLPEGHKCRRPHGHSYRFRVEVDGEPDGRGFVADYAEIAEAAAPVVAALDHRDLNGLFDFPTTAENLARWVFEEVSEEGLPVARLVFFETADTSVTYTPSR
jgi:6-pyruvoyltetrahydropterin/6-carboxytetrahydropterin synthase